MPLPVILLILEELLKYSPQMVADLQTLFSGAAPTAADFAALRAKVSSESYAQFVPASALPPAVAAVAFTPTPPPPVTDQAVTELVQVATVATQSEVVKRASHTMPDGTQVQTF